MSASGNQSADYVLSTTRIEAFSGAVFAIVITLTVVSVFSL